MLFFGVGCRSTSLFLTSNVITWREVYVWKYKWNSALLVQKVTWLGMSKLRFFRPGPGSFQKKDTIKFQKNICKSTPLMNLFCCKPVKKILFSVISLFCSFCGKMAEECYRQDMFDNEHRGRIVGLRSQRDALIQIPQKWSRDQSCTPIDVTDRFLKLKQSFFVRNIPLLVVNISSYLM